jgi:oxygen-independent coproporphyrinogen-3 oxidase
VKRERLKEGFARLEAAGYTLRSAYTAVRDPARHHFIYQDEQYRGADLLGLGASAFSCLDGINQQNVTTLDVYLERLAAGQLPLWRAYPMNDRERLVREVVLQMKLGGLDAACFRKKFGVEVLDQFAAALGRFAAAGWVTQQPDGARLTREGLLRVDRLLPELYLPEHRGSRYS